VRATIRCRRYEDQFVPVVPLGWEHPRETERMGRKAGATYEEQYLPEGIVDCCEISTTSPSRSGGAGSSN
jgi:hypothetical protein